jgi:parvulin-like peptidyl-prolyl isomerase
MQKKNRPFLGLAIILLILSVAGSAGAQQPGPPAKPAQKPSTPPVTGKAETQPGKDSSEKVVIKVGNAKITQSEIDFLISNLNPQVQQSLAQQGKRPLGEDYVKVLLLSQRAENEHLESSPQIRERIELQRTQMLAQAEYEKLSNEVKVSPEEIGQYYTAHQPDYARAQVRKFLVMKKPDGAKAEAPGLAPEEAKTKVEAMRKEVSAGTDIKKIIQDFSKDQVVVIDSEPQSVKRGQLLAPLDKAAFELKDGEITDTLETPRLDVFLQIVGHKPAEQNEVSDQIENTLRTQKLEEEIAELRKKTEVWMDEDYF